MKIALEIVGRLISIRRRYKEEKECYFFIREAYNKYPHSPVKSEALENEMGKSLQDIDTIALRLAKKGYIRRRVDKRNYKPVDDSMDFPSFLKWLSPKKAHHQD